MELDDFDMVVLDGNQITRLDLYLHKGLSWVEHSKVDADTLFEEIVGGWGEFSDEEKAEILVEFANLYRLRARGILPG